jgi:aspartate carbamoyltransferase regulatory subunit
MLHIKDKKMEVSAIENGTVIDHIPAKVLFKVISILGLDNIEQQITFGTNFNSQRLGKKAIIKLTDVYLIDKDINKIALVAPQAKLNIIRDYKVIEKRIVEVPEEIIGIVKCMNPKCITNNEKIITRFLVLSSQDVKLKCRYCEKITDQEHMEII